MKLSFQFVFRFPFGARQQRSSSDQLTYHLSILRPPATYTRAVAKRKTAAAAVPGSGGGSGGGGGRFCPLNSKSNNLKTNPQKKNSRIS
jgi:hypothetical protein